MATLILYALILLPKTGSERLKDGGIRSNLLSSLKMYSILSISVSLYASSAMALPSVSLFANAVVDCKLRSKKILFFSEKDAIAFSILSIRTVTLLSAFFINSPFFCEVILFSSITKVLYCSIKLLIIAQL